MDKDSLMFGYVVMVGSFGVAAMLLYAMMVAYGVA